MDKDFNLKRDRNYSKSHLREKISDSIKQIRDDAREVKEAPVKALEESFESNRDRENPFKHYQNKFYPD